MARVTDTKIKNGCSEKAQYNTIRRNMKNFKSATL